MRFRHKIDWLPTMIGPAGFQNTLLQILNEKNAAEYRIEDIRQVNE